MSLFDLWTYIYRWSKLAIADINLVYSCWVTLQQTTETRMIYLALIALYNIDIFPYVQENVSSVIVFLLSGVY